MKKLFYSYFLLSSTILYSQSIIIASADKDIKVHFAKLTDTISSKISYTDVNGLTSKTKINENTRIDCPGHQSYFITKEDLTKDTIYLNREVVLLSEVNITNKEDYEIGNIEGFKFKKDYNISDLPFGIYIGIELKIDERTFLKKVNFVSSKKSNENQVLRARIFKKVKKNYQEIVIGNLFSAPVIKGKNSIYINRLLDEGHYFVCLEKVNDQIDYLLSIGKSKTRKKENNSASYFVNTRNGLTEAIPMNMKSGYFDVELMMSLTLN